MRLLRAWVPALVAGGLWLVSAWVEWLTDGSTARPARVLDLLAPETVPVGHLTAPAPWNLVLPLLWVLAVVGAHAGLLAAVRVRRGAAPPLTAFVAYWMCAVVAGAVVAAVPVAAGIVTGVLQQELPTGLPRAYLATAAHWGLVWGWLAAMVAVALDGPARGVRADAPAATDGRSRLALVAAGAGLFLAAAVGLGVASGAAVAA
ncbi:MAG TPA: hypothetical protein VK046_00350 [Actinomycetaceae bacterium]|nr:hypothetical protein [Actinomycetaceae bacterium]